MEILNVSVDRLTIVGGCSDRRLLNELGVNPFVKWHGRAKYPYDFTWSMEDGSVLQLAAPGAEVRTLRYDFNPNKWDSKSMKDSHIMSVLRLMKNVALTRIDIAIDVVGEDLGKYNWIDLKKRKREKHEDGRGNLETLYIGSPSSEVRLRIYNKAKEREDKEKVSNHPLWWRVESQMRGEAAEKFMEHNPFDDVCCTKKFLINDDGELSEYDLKTRSMVYYLSHFPDSMSELSKNSRTKYRELLAATSEHISEDTFSEIFEDNREKIRDIVHTYTNLTCGTFNLSNDEETTELIEELKKEISHISYDDDSPVMEKPLHVRWRETREK